MCTCVSVVLVTLLAQSLCISIISHRQKDIISKTRKELPEVRILCELGDLVIISAHVLSGKKAVYHLYTPKGDIRKLDIKPPKTTMKEYSDYDTLLIKTYKDTSVLLPTTNYQVFNLNHYTASVCASENGSEIECRERNMNSNDFMIGPLGEDDYGNWVLSAFYKDSKGEWAEVNQMFVFDIREKVPSTTNVQELYVGDTFEFGFAYPIIGLESCELRAPRSTFDRFYTMNQSKLASCGYVVHNVTKRDSGYWHIVGIGRIAYEAVVRLIVTDI